MTIPNLLEPAMLVPFLNLYAGHLKRSDAVPDWKIPERVSIAGAFVMAAKAATVCEYSSIIEYAIAGAMAGLAAVGAHQLTVQREEGTRMWQRSQMFGSMMPDPPARMPMDRDPRNNP